MLVWMLTLFAAASPFTFPAHDGAELVLDGDVTTEPTVLAFDQAVALGTIDAADCDTSYSDIASTTTLYGVSLHFPANDEAQASEEDTSGEETTPPPAMEGMMFEDGIIPRRSGSVIVLDQDGATVVARHFSDCFVCTVAEDVAPSVDAVILAVIP